MTISGLTDEEIVKKRVQKQVDLTYNDPVDPEKKGPGRPITPNRREAMLMTGGQYRESLRKLNLMVYLFGERIDNVVDHPVIRPTLNAVAMTYSLAHRPEYAEFMTATSHLTCRRINRFTHIHQSTDDLIKKSKMGRLIGSLTGCCFQRCVGIPGE